MVAGSLNVAEIELGVLNRRIDAIEALRNEVTSWQAHRDQINAKVNWHFTTEDARIKLNDPRL